MLNQASASPLSLNNWETQLNLQDLNCSITVKNKKQLEKAVEKMENEKETYNKNMQALNEFSNKFKGLDRAVSIVETLLD